MARKFGPWFIYRGRNSQDLDVQLASAAVYARGEYRGTSNAISGRDGDLYVTDGTTDVSELKCRLRIPRSRVGDVMAWLSGEGELLFEWEPTLAYEASCRKKLEIKTVVPGFHQRDALLEGTITFTVQPGRLLRPEMPAFTVGVSGTEIRNPGAFASRPRIRITGSGDFSVTIAGNTVTFSSVSGGGIIVDSDLMDALTYDGTALANTKMSGTPWTLPPGISTVTWDASGGSVTRLEILPRWRY